MLCVDWVRNWLQSSKIPPLRTYNVTREHTNELVEKAAKASSMKANPIVLTPEELAHILESAL